MKLLLSILFCVFIANAIAPKGTIVMQSVTINSAYVSETSSHFLLQFKVPRTGLVAANCDSAKHIAMTGVSDTIRVPRWVVFTTDTLFIYADVSKSSSINTVYNLHFSKTFNEINTQSAFTNCGIVSIVGSDTIDGTSILDYANGNILTTEGSYTKSIFSNGSVTTHAQDIAGFPLLGGMTTLTTTCVITPDDAATANVCLTYRVSAPAFQWSFTNVGLYVAFSNSIHGLHNTSILSSGSTYHIAVVYNGAGATNADKVKLYINGESKALTFTGTIPSSITTISGADTRFGLRDVTINSFSGIMDNHIIYSTPQTIGCITDQYNMLFNPSSFFTLGSIQYITALNKLSGKHNDIVDVRGQFNDTGSLYLNNTRLTTTYWTDSLIKFTVPNISRGYYNFITDIGGYRDTLSSLFRVKVPSVKIDSIRIRR